MAQPAGIAMPCRSADAPAAHQLLDLTCSNDPQNFSITASASTSCWSVPVGKGNPYVDGPVGNTCSKNAEDLCPSCSGEFRMELATGDNVKLDMVFLQDESMMYKGQPTRSGESYVIVSRPTRKILSFLLHVSVASSLDDSSVLSSFTTDACRGNCQTWSG